ncbi:MAG: hypothetical protein P857_580 [Candidatus Xenolissoclinum pacificiensis L6]|uniref:Uncharacterized protein n=1 Tax=Candidatus Xenolissoclinum pacificiensis L6 TaxID=1401685 RepID=W2UYT4_9RICK|nr:MAG: hypothetical protein P857_580 [Candidatus Xenolissoclinum pacificiensis L6]
MNKKLLLGTAAMAMLFMSSTSAMAMNGSMKMSPGSKGMKYVSVSYNPSFTMEYDVSVKTSSNEGEYSLSTLKSDNIPNSYMGVGAEAGMFVTDNVFLGVGMSYRGLEEFVDGDGNAKSQPVVSSAYKAVPGGTVPQNVPSMVRFNTEATYTNVSNSNSTAVPASVKLSSEDYAGSVREDGVDLKTMGTDFYGVIVGFAKPVHQKFIPYAKLSVGGAYVKHETVSGQELTGFTPAGEIAIGGRIPFTNSNIGVFFDVGFFGAYEMELSDVEGNSWDTKFFPDGMQDSTTKKPSTTLDLLTSQAGSAQLDANMMKLNIESSGGVNAYSMIVDNAKGITYSVPDNITPNSVGAAATSVTADAPISYNTNVVPFYRVTDENPSPVTALIGTQFSVNVKLGVTIAF